MKRIVLNIFALFLITTGAIAQVVINPGSIVLEADGSDQIYQEIRITNNSTVPIDIYWNYEPGANYPDNWKTQICDLNSCYDWDGFESLTVVSNVVGAGEEILFTLKIKNNINEAFPVNGSSYGILRLFDDAEKMNEVAVTSGVTAINDINVDDLVIYPNPTTEFFQLKNDASVSTISLYNIVGRLVKTFNHSEGMIHDVTSLRSGMYLVRIENKAGDVLKSMRLSKK